MHNCIKYTDQFEDNLYLESYGSWTQYLSPSIQLFIDFFEIYFSVKTLHILVFTFISSTWNDLSSIFNFNILYCSCILQMTELRIVIKDFLVDILGYSSQTMCNLHIGTILCLILQYVCLLFCFHLKTKYCTFIGITYNVLIHVYNV
jgi:hypothetical protein